MLARTWMLFVAVYAFEFYGLSIESEQGTMHLLKRLMEHIGATRSGLQFYRD